MRIGLSLDWFWDHTDPKQFKILVESYVQNEDDKLRRQDFLNHVLGVYVSYAVNDTKNYPKEPKLKKQPEQKEMSGDELDRQLRAITTAMGGKVIKKKK